MPYRQQALIENELHSRACHIRNEVLPIDGDADAETMRGLIEFISRLAVVELPEEVIKHSRIHLALLEILDSASGWPQELLDQVQSLIQQWSSRYGNLKDLGIELYGPGGRLHGICGPSDISWRALVTKWHNDRDIVVDPEVSHVHGGLKFTPGAWWIHPVFAFRDGIIGSADPKGGLTFDSEGCYAITLTDNDTVVKHDSHSFTYQVRSQDPGWARLVGSFLPEKPSIRILRSHSLDSPFKPSVGVRYDGLYKITSWRHKFISGAFINSLTMTREQTPPQPSMGRVRSHPTADERDDFAEHMRNRQLHLIIQLGPVGPAADHAAHEADRGEMEDAEADEGAGGALNAGGGGMQGMGMHHGGGRWGLRRSMAVPGLKKLGEEHGVRSEDLEVALSAKDQQELAELREFSFPALGKGGELKRARKMPSLFSAERL